ncbi:MAG: Chaperone for flagella basal body P-ring formation [Pseudomonadota bacterium]|jgi:flagella basal body P-ring formation protein FlgA
MLAALLASALAATPSQAVRLAAARQAGVSEDDVEVGMLGLPPATAERDAAWEVQFPAGGAFTGATPVLLVSDGARFQLRPRIVVTRTVAVAAASARPGERVELVPARVGSDRIRGEVPVPLPSGPDAARGWQARVAIAAGEPVTTARVRPYPDRLQGTDVKVVADVGRLSVRAPGRLLEDAFVGAQVGVLNLATRAVQRGVYHGDGIVALESP